MFEKLLLKEKNRDKLALGLNFCKHHKCLKIPHQNKWTRKEDESPGSLTILHKHHQLVHRCGVSLCMLEYL